MDRKKAPSNAMLRLNSSLAWREFDGEIAVYDEASGNSFLVSGMAARIFAAIRQGPIGKAELARQLLGDTVADAQGDGASVFEESLAFLQELEAVST
jgi:PqqD family protein of HPr-rel-A system